MQIDGVVLDEKHKLRIQARTDSPNEVRTENGAGKAYLTTLTEKLICLIANKLASLDPEGTGIEMEADKPNWCDALNGLPGQHGSSLSETVELKRHVQFLLEALTSMRLKAGDKIAVCAEVGSFVKQLDRLLVAALQTNSLKSDFIFWDKTATTKESFRKTTRAGVSGTTQLLTVGFIKKFLQKALVKLDRGIDKVWKQDGRVPPTYFINKVVAHEVIADGNGGDKQNARGLTCYRARQFKQHALPSFLEGPVHLLRIEKDTVRAGDLAASVKASGLYDRNLRMYKVNEDLTNQPLEIGRIRSFSRGWLENESIWLHMEYKYMLELLRSGQHQAFYNNFKNVLVPFMDPVVYGRSILEASSFIASSANPDKSMHGAGFMARLSGATAEFVHILLMMCVGPRPFKIEKNQLVLEFSPVLPEWLFTTETQQEKLWVGNRKRNVVFDKDTFSFMFLGNTLVIYHNPTRGNTYGTKTVKPIRIKITDKAGRVAQIASGTIIGQWAQRIRKCEIQRLDIELG